MLKLSPALLALFAGAMLSLMILLNSQLAAHSSPLLASWVAHGIGAAFAGFILFVCHLRSKRTRPAPRPVPKWAYLGGIPGAFTVILAAATVNSPLGLSGSVAFMLVGQTLFGMLSDVFGLMGSKRRKLSSQDLVVVCCILSGSMLIIFTPS
ncbi:DMT family transporter [Photobacterium sp. TLY01]|uniref:DMT family transporter n=1 Tax=Photobacterium sp. TLY01 TaxID=2907534 RepID=UPI001F365262|nr:DMT family transporter [Photobacterium sp. TLY01]UIP30170.1 DMT family transporter [Photobacterium sp. TLY01]